MRTRKLLVAAVLGTSIVLQSACGTLLHPERKGQTQTNRLDASVVILDGIGLFFFLIPGLVAFAIDFSNNTIYLPDDESAAVDGANLGRALTVDGPMDAAAIEAIIERELAVASVVTDARLQVREGALSPFRRVAF